RSNRADCGGALRGIFWIEEEGGGVQSGVMFAPPSFERSTWCIPRCGGNHRVASSVYKLATCDTRSQSISGPDSAMNEGTEHVDREAARRPVFDTKNLADEEVARTVPKKKS